MKVTAWLAVDAVYPRVCGGADLDTRDTGRSEGLSPRVRGSHRHASRISAARRSIPACAGEPGAPTGR